MRVISSSSILELPDLTAVRRQAFLVVEGDRVHPPGRLLEVFGRGGGVFRVPIDVPPAVVKVIDRSRPVRGDNGLNLGASVVWDRDELLICIDRKERLDGGTSNPCTRTYLQSSGEALWVCVDRGVRVEQLPQFAQGVVWGRESWMLETCTQAAIDALPRPETLVGLYRGMIQQHVERRVALFFQQLIVTFGTDLHLTIGKVVAQAASGKALVVLKPDGRRVTICGYQGAHSSTLPCLHAQYGREWRRHQEGGAPEPRKFIYMGGASGYSEANATNNLPTIVNDADSWLDWKGRGHLLRPAAIDLLNRASAGEIQPQAALREFLGAMTRRIAQLRRQMSTPAEVKLVLREFGQVVTRLRGELDDDDSELFYHWLGIRVDQAEEAAAVRRLVHRLRFAAIRKNQLKQAKMAATIDQVTAPWRGNLNYFDAVFRQRLIRAMRTDEDRNRLRIFFSHSGAIRLTGRRTTLWNTTDRALAGHDNEIRALASRLRDYMYDMRVEEEQERAGITRRLRNAKGWTQVDLGEEIRVFHPSEPSSQPTISRCETGKRVIRDDLASKLAEVFEVDSATFMPAFFNR
jgi:DNA-binding XRE family transcriptional regulator